MTDSATPSAGTSPESAESLLNIAVVAERQVLGSLQDLAGFAMAAGLVGVICWIATALSMRADWSDGFTVHSGWTFVFGAGAVFCSFLAAAMVAGRAVVRSMLLAREADLAWAQSGRVRVQQKI